MLRKLIEEGAATMDADPGSLPIDPAAILTTIGTGALPSDHGITGSYVRNDDGKVVVPWGRGSPFSVVATLGDHLDEVTDQVARIALIGSNTSDRGLIGGNWYIEHDRDYVNVPSDPMYGQGSPESVAVAAEELLTSDYADDSVTDLLGAVMRSRDLSRLDEALGRIVRAAKAASGDSFVLAITSTGSSEPHSSEAFPAWPSLGKTLGGSPVLDQWTPGGFFLDREAMTETGLSEDKVVNALRRVVTTDGEPLFADVFPAIAVTFARYC